LLSWCCALSLLTLITFVQPLRRMVGDLLVRHSESLVVAVPFVVLAVAAVWGSLYFYLAVWLHLIRSRMGRVRKTAWGAGLLLGGTLAAAIYFLMVWPAEG
jgi:hypothetical protein